MDPLTIIGMAGKAAQGVAGIIGGIVGSQARKDEQETATSQFDKRMRSYESFDFQNLYNWKKLLNVKKSLLVKIL